MARVLILGPPSAAPLAHLTRPSSSSLRSVPTGGSCAAGANSAAAGADSQADAASHRGFDASGHVHSFEVGLVAKDRVRGQ
jgi:hypothetical protein